MNEREALKLALEYVQEFKSLWWKVPTFANRVNKATREAISFAHNPIFQLEDVLRQAIAEAEKRHYCPEWDFLEITKDDPEFEACLCFSQKPDAWVADVGEPPTEEEKQEHITDGSTCWCGPETNYTDPETGASVIVHREPQ